MSHQWKLHLNTKGMCKFSKKIVNAYFLDPGWQALLQMQGCQIILLKKYYTFFLPDTFFPAKTYFFFRPILFSYFFFVLFIFFWDFFSWILQQLCLRPENFRAPSARTLILDSYSIWMQLAGVSVSLIIAKCWRSLSNNIYLNFILI